MDLDHLSYSSISTYQTCARAWKFHYIDRVPTKAAAALVFGSAFHGVIEDYLTVPGGDLQSTWAERWHAQLEQDGTDAVDWGTDTPEALHNLGVSMFTAKEVIEPLSTIRAMVEDSGPVIERRVTLQVPGVPIPVIGYIDIITDDGVPGDFKTSARRWSDARGSDEMQPVFYLAALNQAAYAGNPERRFRHYVFTKTKKPELQIIETTRTAGELLWLLDMIRSVWEGIAAGAFPMNPSTWKCSPQYCEYWSRCRGRYG